MPYTTAEIIFIDSRDAEKFYATAARYAASAAATRNPLHARYAVEDQHVAADLAAGVMFKRLLLIHDDVDAAEAAFDYCGDASTEA
jgi:hypothetical protein